MIAGDLSGTIASGLSHCLAVVNGRVVAWGDDDFGQLAVPNGLTDVVSVAAGHRHSLALTKNGTVTAWGFSLNGAVNVPVGLSDVVDIAAGGDTSAAILRDGRALIWGEFASGSSQEMRSPDGPVISVGVGDIHLAVLDAAGDMDMMAFGLSPSYEPVAPPANRSGITAISVAAGHCLALRRDGTVTAWGRNDYGQCEVPPGLANPSAISAGAATSLALTSDGRVISWGVTIDDDYKDPFPADLRDVVAIAAGSQCLALRRDGTLIAWGERRRPDPAVLSVSRADQVH